MALLEVKDLVCSYRSTAGTPGNGGRTAVLNGVTFSLHDHGCLGLIGDSGSGKSTIARCVAGLTRPSAGSISILGRNVFPEVRNRALLRGKVQMLYQDHSASLDPIMTVRESLAEGVCAHSGLRRAGDAVIRRLLHDVGLDRDIAGMYPRQISGGERQRVALARSMSARPALLVLDEPTSSLDAGTQEQILGLIRSLQHATQTAILFISHDIASIVRICDHIAVLCDGRIVEYGPTEAILANPSHEYTQRIAAITPSVVYPL